MMLGQEANGNNLGIFLFFFILDNNGMLSVLIRITSTSADSRRAVVISGERMCTILVNRLEDEACPVKVILMNTHNIQFPDKIRKFS